MARTSTKRKGPETGTRPAAPEHGPTAGASKFGVRAGQREFERGVDDHRICGLLARRQYGKTTIASRIALKKMMRWPGHTVIFGSVKVDLGREIVRKEGEAMRAAFAILADQAKEAESLLDLVDTEKSCSVVGISQDDFADLYESSRLEFRLYHDRTTYSRTKVVALTPAAVGETGDLILDEVGRVKKFREVWEAVRPIIASNPQFRCILTTTPPPDDTHYSFDLLAPPVDAHLPVSKIGNWYRSDLGIWVLRVTAWDAFEDGIPLYDDDTGEALSPDESRAKDHDKDAWDRNYGCQFVIGGTAAVGLLVLNSAQVRGIGRCTLIQVDTDADFDHGLSWLRCNLKSGRVGLGWDVATTEKESSNPSSFTVAERDGVDLVGLITWVWKTRDPALAKDRARRIIEAVASRKEGGRARRLCIDASNEAYFAEECRREFASMVPVECVKGGESIDVPGGDSVNMKTHLGSLLVGEIDDNHAVLAPERYLKDDFRRVKKDRGTFVAEVGPAGEHGDTFDSHKLALWALVGSGDGITSLAGVRLQTRRAGRPLFRPRRLPAFRR